MHNSTELWSLNIVDNTINQIEYHFEMDAFKNAADALQLARKLQQLAQKLEVMAERGKKIDGDNNKTADVGNFTLYHNEIVYTNNTILVESDFYNCVYCTFGNPNFLKSTDQRITQYTQKWFADVISKSTQLSAQGEKGRRFFFKRLYERIDRLIHHIEASIK